jgi:response regulator RpfG family c-di-GMP phosphodiesterase
MSGDKVVENRPRVLCIDDEAMVLDTFSRILRRDFEVVAAQGGEAGLARLSEDLGFMVILSDLRMPKIDGVTLLTQAQRLAPDATRILITGNADVRSAARAVNEGRVFRLLTKPCPPGVLQEAVSQAVKHYHLVTAERDLLEQTLHGSVQMLIDLLAISSPAAFGRANRARRLIGELAAMIGFRDRWQMEMAAMLSQVGILTLPPALAARYGEGAELEPEEEEQVARLPAVALNLLKEIPRLDEIREILTHANDRFEAGNHDSGPGGQQIPLGARMLRVVVDFDRLCSRGYPPPEAVARLRAHTGCYDPDVLSDLVTVIGVHTERVLRELPFQQVELGMVFVDDVRAADRTLLVARGQEVTPGLLERIEDYWSDLELPGPVRVTWPAAEPALHL